MGFSRQEYWSGLPFPSPRDVPNPGIGPRSPTLQADALTSEAPGRKQHNREGKKKKKTQNADPGLEKAMAPTPVLLPGNSHGWRKLVGCSPWGRRESDTTERLYFHFSLSCIGEGNAAHSSVLAWRIPGMAEPGGLPSMGSHRVGHD